MRICRGSDPVFGTCPVCGDRGDFVGTSPRVLIGSTDELGDTSRTFIYGIKHVAAMMRGNKITPDIEGQLQTILVYGVCGSKVVGLAHVWAAVYEVGGDGVTATKVGETLATTVETIAQTTIPWLVQYPDLSWISLTLVKPVTLDPGKEYFIVFKTDAEMGMEIGADSGGDLPLYSYSFGGATAFPDSASFTLTDAGWDLAMYGTSIVRDEDEATQGNGLELVDYKGSWMCPKCKRTQMMEDESRPAIEAYRQEDDERARLGYIKTYPG